MGLFQHRPEEPTDWAGLPSEPFHESDAERLDGAVPVDLGLGDLLGTGTSASVVIPVEVVQPDASSDD